MELTTASLCLSPIICEMGGNYSRDLTGDKPGGLMELRTEGPTQKALYNHQHLASIYKENL